MGTTADRAFDHEQGRAAAFAEQRDLIENPDKARAAFEDAANMPNEALEWIANVNADEVPPGLMAAIIDAFRRTDYYDECVAMYVAQIIR